MNLLHTIIFIVFVPFVQIFFIDSSFPAGSFIKAPSLVIASIILFAIKKDYFYSYTYAFLAGIISSVIYGLPAGASACSYLLIIFFVRKLSGNFDISGYAGRFALGAAAAIFNYFYLMLLSAFLEVPRSTFPAASFGALFTGVLTVLVFSVFFKKHKPVI